MNDMVSMKNSLGRHPRILQPGIISISGRFPSLGRPATARFEGRLDLQATDVFILLVVFTRACLCLSILAKPLYPQETVYINKRCYLGPLLSRDLMRSLPDAVRGSVVGPEKHNVMRLCMQHLVSASINPKQVLELFSREFYQSKKNR